MKKIVLVLVMISFALSVSGLSFAQSASTTAQEKASDNAAFNRKDAKSAGKSNAEKMKGEKEKAVKETGKKEKAAKGKVEKGKTAHEKAAKEKGKAAQDKVKFNPDDIKKQ
ncbi:MAG TPA: hypothetical protein VLR50_19005 [Desulfobacterales bacterium]|nr:hypothetical protein [Desulfobacterales bacterium]